MTARREFIRQIGLSTIGFGLLPSLGFAAEDRMYSPFMLPRSTPRATGNIFNRYPAIP